MIDLISGVDSEPSQPQSEDFVLKSLPAIELIEKSLSEGEEGDSVDLKYKVVNPNGITVRPTLEALNQLSESSKVLIPESGKEHVPPKESTDSLSSRISMSFSFPKALRVGSVVEGGAVQEGEGFTYIQLKGGKGYVYMTKGEEGPYLEQLKEGSGKYHNQDLEAGEEKEAPRAHPGWEMEPIHHSVKAMKNERHRSRLLESLRGITDLISRMQSESDRLVDPKTLSTPQALQVAEKIDEEVHRLQYMLDHATRLLEGSESELSHSPAHVWLTVGRVQNIRKGLNNLKATAEHIHEHIDEVKDDSQIDLHLIQELHRHMEDMDRQIDAFHGTVQKAASRWRRKRTMPEVEEGDTLPMSLVIPVTLDCFVDGFMIGISVGVAPAAGIILGAANCLEMSFLGIAYAVRITKCTGSTPLARLTALYGPPILMCLSAGLGSLIGDASRAVPAVYIGFVSFGSVALLMLCCDELFIEAKELQKEAGGDRFWVSLCIFAGIFIVLMTSIGLE